MKFDYYILNSYVRDADGDAVTLYRSWLAQAIAADRLGYEIFWATEHHFRIFGGMLPNPQLLLSAIAPATTRIRLGTAVSTLPLHNPVRVAEDFAMLDNLSEGRIECGFGRGMLASEYDTFEKEWGVAQETLEEAVEMFEHALADPELVWHGKHFNVDPPVTVYPPPVQKRPRIWMTANRSVEHFEWIGHHGYNLMTLPWMFPTLEAGRSLIGAYQSALARAGHDIADHEILGMLPAFVATRSDDAHDEAERGWAAWRKLSSDEHGGRVDPDFLSYSRMVSDSRGIFGDPSECRAHVDRLGAELGLTRLALVQHFGGISQDRVLESMKLFATEVA
jgi:alkanesulfonate monooxygenase SsuD/methylene tetrahydromethanopterin reductase-like flavin-dependent oxidoreductase (luciferase family)